MLDLNATSMPEWNKYTHLFKRQEIPATDSSNVIGTDTIGASESTPNTGTVKSANDQKGAKDTTQKQ